MRWWQLWGNSTPGARNWSQRKLMKQGLLWVSSIMTNRDVSACERTVVWHCLSSFPTLILHYSGLRAQELLSKEKTRPIRLWFWFVGDTRCTYRNGTHVVCCRVQASDPILMFALFLFHDWIEAFWLDLIYLVIQHGQGLFVLLSGNMIATAARNRPWKMLFFFFFFFSSTWMVWWTQDECILGLKIDELCSKIGDLLQIIEPCSSWVRRISA